MKLYAWWFNQIIEGESVEEWSMSKYFPPFKVIRNITPIQGITGLLIAYTSNSLYPLPKRSKNMSVFSNYLSPYVEEGILQDVDQTKPSNVYAQLSIAYNQGSVGVMNATRWFVPYYEEQDPDDFDEQLLYDIWSNNHLQELIKWFNSKVIPEFTTMSYQTINVIIRIFCSKLNKLVDEGLVSKETAIKIHLNLVETIKEEHNALINEDLPF